MARSIWSGSVSFGLVNIPVKLFSATRSHRVSFREFEEGTGQRIRYRRVAETSGRDVPWQKIRKGLEVGKGRYVVMSDEELRAAAPSKTGAIEIEQFVSLDEIDPVNWDQTYYLGAAGVAAAKAYGLLLRAMQDSARVAIGRFVMRTKEHVVCIRPYEGALALETMFFADEVLRPKEIADVPPRASFAQRELSMARQLIDSLTAPWEPARFKDTFTTRVMDLARQKGKGEEIVVSEAPEEGGRVVDLMAALKATLAQRQPRARARATARRPAQRKRARG
jgi:DNA end-binding protein Ku